MSGFGSFMEGFQGGMKSISDIKDAQELRKARKALRERQSMENADRNADRVLGGLPGFEFEPETKSYLERFGDWMGNGFQTLQKKVASREGALPGIGGTDFGSLYEEQNPLIDPEALPTLGQDLDLPEYKDGSPGGVKADGTWDWAEDEPEKKRRYNPDSKEEIERRRTASRTSSKPADAVNDTTKPKPSAIPEGPKKGFVGRGIDKVKGGVKGAAALGASIGGITSVAENALDADGKLEDYYRRIGRDPARAKDYRPVEHAAMRGIGFLQDMGKGVTSFIPGLNDALHVNDGANEASAATPAPEEAIPLAGSPRRPGGPGPSRGRTPAPAAPTAPAAPSQAIPTAKPDPLAGFDVSNVDPKDIPRMSTAEWDEHKTQIMQSYIRSGKSYAEAMDLADQQVANQQRRGFLMFGQQAAALAEAGNLKGAAAAITAAFQNMPTTTDVNVTIYNGHLVAYGVDEETGEQVGQPVVLNAQRIQDILRNFSDPKVWGEYVQTNRKLDQGDRALGQVDRELDQRDYANKSDRIVADARMLDAQGGAMGGGVSAKDLDRIRPQIESITYRILATLPKDALPEGMSPERLGLAIQNLAMDDYRQSGNADQTIAKINEIAQSPGGVQWLIEQAAAYGRGQ